MQPLVGGDRQMIFDLSWLTRIVWLWSVNGTFLLSSQTRPVVATRWKDCKTRLWNIYHSLLNLYVTSDETVGPWVHVSRLPEAWSGRAWCWVFPLIEYWLAPCWRYFQGDFQLPDRIPHSFLYLRISTKLTKIQWHTFVEVWFVRKVWAGVLCCSALLLR